MDPNQEQHEQEQAERQAGETPASAEQTGAGEQEQGQGQAAAEQSEPVTFEGWLAEQGEGVKALIEAHTSGVRSALSGERAERKRLEKEVKALAQKAEKGSELEKQLTALQQSMDLAAQKMAFYESAPSDLENAKLAWLAVQDGDLFRRDGSVDWDALRESAPQLFRKKQVYVPRGEAGSGVQQNTPPSPPNMNDLIRGRFRS